MAREGTKTAVALPHILPVRAPYQKNKEVEVLPVVDLFQESAKKKKKKMWAIQHRKQVIR